MNKYKKSFFLLFLLIFSGLFDLRHTEASEIRPLSPKIEFSVPESKNLTIDDRQILERQFQIALTHSFSQLGLFLLDRDKEMEGASNKENNDRGILELKLQLVFSKDNKLKPYLIAKDLTTKEIVSSISTFDIEFKSSIQEIEASSISLARATIRKLFDSGFQNRPKGSPQVKKASHDITLSLENFDVCEQDFLIDIMENEFPGFISIELKKSPTKFMSVYKYTTYERIQKIKKWLGVILFQAGISADDFMILVNQKKVRVVAQSKINFLDNCVY
jgi:hypothetical protein